MSDEPEADLIAYTRGMILSPLGRRLDGPIEGGRDGLIRR